MDTKQLINVPLYAKFKKMVCGLDKSDPCNLLYYAIIDLVSGKKENVLHTCQLTLMKKSKQSLGYSQLKISHTSLWFPLKEGFPGMWSAIGRMLDRDDVEKGVPEMCAALEHLYYDSKNENIIESLTQVLRCNPNILLAKELLGYTYYNMQMWGNALSYFEQFEDGKPTSRFFLEGRCLYRSGPFLILCSFLSPGARSYPGRTGRGSAGGGRSGPPAPRWLETTR